MIAGLCLLLEQAVFAAPVVIVNPSCGATGDLDVARKIFLGKERSLCGGTVQPADVDDANPLRAAFLEKIVDKNESELRQYWSRLIFTGKATAPRNVGNDAAVKAFVAGNKDGIGVIDDKAVDATVKVFVKVE